MEKEFKEQKQLPNLDMESYFGPPLSNILGPLSTEKAKSFTEGYKKLVHDHLVALIEQDKALFEAVQQLLRDMGSYTPSITKQGKKLNAGVTKVLELVEDTAEWPHERLSSLSDLVDEAKTNLFPFNHLNLDSRREVQELCEVCRGIHDCSNLYVDTVLGDQFLLWEVDLLKSRTKSGFKV